MPVSSCGKPNAINNDYIPFGYILIATKKKVTTWGLSLPWFTTWNI
jgi:hypothetical protein